MYLYLFVFLVDPRGKGLWERLAVTLELSGNRLFVSNNQRQAIIIINIAIIFTITIITINIAIIVTITTITTNVDIEITGLRL